MRTAFGVVLIVLGLPVLLAGAGAAIITGPDDTVEVAHEDVSTDASVLTTAGSLVDVTGPIIHVSADGGDVETFVGVAHPVHVASYLTDVAQERVTRVRVDDITWASVEGTGAAPAVPPGGLDWWQDSTSGTGEQTVSVELSEQPLRVVVMPAQPSGPLDVGLTIEAELEGVFVTAALAGAAGLVLLIGGLLLLRSARRRRKAKAALARAGEPPPADPPAEPEAAPAGAVGTTGSDASSDERVDGDTDGDAPGNEDGETGAEDGDRGGDVIPLHGPRPAPPPPPAPEPPRPTARVSVLLGLGVCTLVTGCAQIPQPIDDAERSMSAEAVSRAAADKFFAHYTETNNSANAERDHELISTVEAGTLLEASRFDYEAQQVQGDEPWEPFIVTVSSVAAPRLDEYPMWSFVTTTSGQSDGESWYLITRDDAVSPWLAQVAVHLPPDVKIPAPVTEDDAAVVADSDLAEQGLTVLDELVAFGQTGTEPEGVDLTHAGGLNSMPEHGLQLDDAPPAFGTSGRTCTVPDTDDVHWLATEFGAMTLTSIECTQTMEANPGYWVTIDGAGHGTIPGDAQIVRSSITQSVSFILSVDSDGSATVVGDRMRPVDMTYTAN